jgi:putative phosphoribosyl transferase
MGNVRIVSRSDEPFKDRIEAGNLLAGQLNDYSGKDAVVLGIPRGGVVIAREIAKIIGGELDIVLSRKLGAPGNPELAIGSVSEDGKLFLNELVIGRNQSAGPYIEREKAHQLEEIKRRVEIFRKARAKVRLQGRQVILTDDGLATGATMEAAIWAARHEGARKVVVAVPVAPEDTVERIKDGPDEMIVLRLPRFFSAVGQFYEEFGQTTDEEVVEILKEENI